MKKYTKHAKVILDDFPQPGRPELGPVPKPGSKHSHKEQAKHKKKCPETEVEAEAEILHSQNNIEV